MEYVEGVRVVRHRGSIRCNRAPGTVSPGVRGGGICASNLVVHRDFKPGNILVTDGAPKLLDFGIAKVIDAESGREHTATVNLFLTPMYASPEMLRG